MPGRTWRRASPVWTTASAATTPWWPAPGRPPTWSPAGTGPRSASTSSRTMSPSSSPMGICTTWRSPVTPSACRASHSAAWWPRRCAASGTWNRTCWCRSAATPPPTGCWNPQNPGMASSTTPRGPWTGGATCWPRRPWSASISCARTSRSTSWETGFAAGTSPWSSTDPFPPPH
ncbi:hypothetical protein ACFFX0_26965 [Citricoccus parietis]|uniref:Secreted protein n=1 Tax=Citricoccus parietis TaxID=592307 RepID=A0ABV5G6S9_9MICC